MEVVLSAICLRVAYGKSGTDLCYCATVGATDGGVRALRTDILPRQVRYAPTHRCLLRLLVLTYRGLTGAAVLVCTHIAVPVIRLGAYGAMCIRPTVLHLCATMRTVHYYQKCMLLPGIADCVVRCYQY